MVVTLDVEFLQEISCGIHGHSGDTGDVDVGDVLSNALISIDLPQNFLNWVCRIPIIEFSYLKGSSSLEGHCEEVKFSSGSDQGEVLVTLFRRR